MQEQRRTVTLKPPEFELGFDVHIQVEYNMSNFAYEFVHCIYT